MVQIKMDIAIGVDSCTYSCDSIHVSYVSIIDQAYYYFLLVNNKAEEISICKRIRRDATGLSYLWPDWSCIILK